MDDDILSGYGPRSRAGILKHLGLPSDAGNEDVVRALAPESYKLVDREVPILEALKQLVHITAMLESKLNLRAVLAAVTEELDVEDATD